MIWSLQVSITSRLVYHFYLTYATYLQGYGYSFVQYFQCNETVHWVYLRLWHSASTLYPVLTPRTISSFIFQLILDQVWTWHAVQLWRSCRWLVAFQALVPTLWAGWSEGAFWGRNGDFAVPGQAEGSREIDSLNVYLILFANSWNWHES